MTELSDAPQVCAAARAILARRDIVGRNPYLAALREGTMPLAAFRLSQRQFYFAVEFFSRPMAALVAKIPDAGQRLDILHNVVEEHGEFEQTRFHATTFKAFLASIDAAQPPLEEQGLWPETRAFNAALTTACILDELEVGVACMGIIEHAFAGISAAIGQALVQLGWVRAEDLVHYKLHAEIDERHAAEFYRVIEPLWEDPARRYYVEQGLELGAYIFDRLYLDLHTRGLEEAGTE